MNETTENFWAAWALPQEPSKPIIYRIYHDDHGNFLFYSMEDIPGNYIEIDQPTFAAGLSGIRVINGKIHYIKTNALSKLVCSDQGHACDPRDVAVITTDKNRQYWKLKTTNDTN
jgi:hypothetical protein